MKKFSQLKFKKIDLEKIKSEFSSLVDEFKNSKTFEEQDKALTKIFKYSDELQTNMTIGEIRYTLDTRSKVNQKNQEMIDEVSPHISALFNSFEKELVKAKFIDDLKKKWGSYLFEMTKQSLECFDEKIIPELQEINRLSSEYTKLISSAQIDFHGEICNLSQLSKHTQSADRQERKEASKLFADFFNENYDKIGEKYDKMV